MTRTRNPVVAVASAAPTLLATVLGCTPPEQDGDTCGSDCEADEGRGSGEAEAGGGGDDSGGAALGTGLPCEVREALAHSCWECHGQPRAYGAPMALTSREAFMLPARSDETRRVQELVAERIVDEAKPMPPTRDLADGDRTAILAWIAAGVPAYDGPACDGGGEEAGDDGGSEGEPEPPEVDLGCDPEERLRFLAHAPDDLAAPYAVPEKGAGDLYQCFAFASTFEPGSQATGWAPIIDDKRVVHHWILYRTTTAPAQGDGSVYACDASLQLSADFVAGWAPGGREMVMPPDVGLDLGGPEHWYILQVHYHNQAEYADARDRSGVEFCPVDEPRPNVAGVLTLGSVAGLSIPAGSVRHPVSGTCDPIDMILWPDVDYHILMGSPHMHQLGRGMTTELVRFDGSRQMVTDVPNFSFDFQIGYRYDPPFVFRKTDTLTTTCYFDNPGTQTVGFGEKTSDEMCFNFSLMYPIDVIGNRNCGAVF